MTFDLTLPENVTYVRSTPEFDEATVPAGLLRAHQVAAGVWGLLVVSEGVVEFTFEDDSDTSRVVTAGETQVIPPSRPHHIVVRDPAKFHVEFHREGEE